jgi:hypothetical protein
VTRVNTVVTTKPGQGPPDPANAGFVDARVGGGEEGDPEGKGDQGEEEGKGEGESRGGIRAEAAGEEDWEEDDEGKDGGVARYKTMMVRSSVMPAR